MIEIGGPDSFESLLGNLVLRLRLGTPVHLAKGPDRGKDLVVHTPLALPSQPVATIHIECKHTTTSRSISLQDLDTHLKWAEVHSSADILILATNSRFTASLIDWLKQTSSQRIPTLCWDGEYINFLINSLSSETEASDIREDVKRTITSSIIGHRALVSTMPPSHSPAHFHAIAYTGASDFVDRDEELERIMDFNSYSTFGMHGPPGVGKSYLVRTVLSQVGQEGLLPIPLAVSEGNSDNVVAFLQPLATTAANARSDDRLASYLRYFPEGNLSGLTSAVSALLNDHSLYLVVEDLHRLHSGARIGQLIEEITKDNFHKSRILLTSRQPTLWPNANCKIDSLLALSSFSPYAISAYLDQYKLQSTDSLLELIETTTGGFPLLLALACNGLKRLGASEGEIPSVLLAGMESLCERLLSGLSLQAQELFLCLALSRSSLQQDDLQILLALSESRLARAIEELECSGLTVPNFEGSLSVHETIAKVLVPSHSKAQPLNFRLGQYLSSFIQSPAKLLAGLEHLIDSGMVDEFAKVLGLHVHTLIRGGYVQRVLDLASEVDPAGISEKSFLYIVLGEAKAWETLGHLEEARNTLATHFTVSVVNELSPRMATEYRYQMARLLYFSGQYEKCRTEICAALKIARDCDDLLQLRITALLYSLQGRLYFINHAYEEAEKVYSMALEMQLQIEDALGANKTRHRLAMIRLRQGDLTVAEHELLRVERESRRLFDSKRLAYSLHRLGEVLQHKGKLDEAEARYLESLAIKKVIGHRRGFIYSYIGLAKLAVRTGNLGEADRHLKRALHEAIELEMPKEEAACSGILASVKAMQGFVGEAEQWCARAEKIFNELGLSRRAQKVRATLEKDQQNGKAN